MPVLYTMMLIDESKQRRGKPTINGVWDNRIAVLVGDYFVSCALKRSISTGILEVINTLGFLGQELAKGEIDPTFDSSRSCFELKKPILM